MAKWDGSTDLNNWKHAAETCAKRILAINPNILIVVEGVEVYPKPGYDYTAVDEWEKRVNISITVGGNLRGVRDIPLTLASIRSSLYTHLTITVPSYINNLGSMKALTKKLCIMIAGEITGHTYTRKTSLL